MEELLVARQRRARNRPPEAWVAQTRDSSDDKRSGSHKKTTEANGAVPTCTTEEGKVRFSECLFAAHYQCASPQGWIQWPILLADLVSAFAALDQRQTAELIQHRPM